MQVYNLTSIKTNTTLLSDGDVLRKIVTQETRIAKLDYCTNPNGELTQFQFKTTRKSYAQKTLTVTNAGQSWGTKSNTDTCQLNVDVDTYAAPITKVVLHLNGTSGSQAITGIELQGPNVVFGKKSNTMQGLSTTNFVGFEALVTGFTIDKIA